MRFAVPPGCSGFDLEDGRSFTVNQWGSIEINDEPTIDAILNCANFREGFIIKIREGNSLSETLPTRLCDGCGRSAWPYQTNCGYCGTALEPIQ